MLVMSTDCTSGHSAMGSKMSSVRTLSSSMTQPIWSFCMPQATSTFCGWLFQTRPSNLIWMIFWASSSRLVSCSQTLTSKTTMDLAAGFSFFLTTTGFLTSAGASSSSLPNRSSFFLSAFCSCLAGAAATTPPAFSTQDLSRSLDQLLTKQYQWWKLGVLVTSGATPLSSKQTLASSAPGSPPSVRQALLARWASISSALAAVKGINSLLLDYRYGQIMRYYLKHDSYHQPRIILYNIDKLYSWACERKYFAHGISKIESILVCWSWALVTIAMKCGYGIISTSPSISRQTNPIDLTSSISVAVAMYSVMRVASSPLSPQRFMYLPNLQARYLCLVSCSLTSSSSPSDSYSWSSMVRMSLTFSAITKSLSLAQLLTRYTPCLTLNILSARTLTQDAPSMLTLQAWKKLQAMRQQCWSGWGALCWPVHSAWYLDNLEQEQYLRSLHLDSRGYFWMSFFTCSGDADSATRYFIVTRGLLTMSTTFYRHRTDYLQRLVPLSSRMMPYPSALILAWKASATPISWHPCFMTYLSATMVTDLPMVRISLSVNLNAIHTIGLYSEKSNKKVRSCKAGESLVIRSQISGKDMPRNVADWKYFRSYEGFRFYYRLKVRGFEGTCSIGAFAAGSASF